MNTFERALCVLMISVFALAACSKKEELASPDSSIVAAPAPAVVPAQDVSLSPEPASVQRQTPRAIADSVARTAATVHQVHDGTAGAPIIVLEEEHLSITGQVELALVLTALHDKHGLTHVVLEGLTRPTLDDGAAKVRASWKTDRAVAHAVALLREGEINSAEFLTLVFPDVHVIQGESAENYAVDLSDDERRAAYAATFLVLAAIAEAQAPTEKTEDLRAELAAMNASGAEVKGAQYAEVLEKLIAVDPWATAKLENLRKLRSIEQDLADWKELQDKAAALGVDIPPELLALQTKSNDFLKARSTASEEMVSAVRRVAGKGSTKVVAVIVGAGHTDRVFDLLKEADWPCAVLSPKSLRSNTSIRLSPKQYERKLSGASVDVDRLFGQAHRKPRPVIEREWFEAKAELYGFADRIAQSGGGSGGNGVPPSGAVGGGVFGPDDFRGQFVYINPDDIERTEEDGRKVAIFPVILSGIEAQRERRTVWIKVTATRAESPESGSGKGAEAQLKEALVEMRNEPGKTPKVEGVRTSAVDLKRISRDTVMIVGASREAVASAKLSVL